MKYPKGQHPPLDAKKHDALATESEFLAELIEYAQTLGWRVAHFRPSMTSRVDKNGKPVWVTPVQADGAGFPDLVLVRDGRLLFVEAKSAKGKLSEAQQQWLNSLSGAAMGSNARIGVYEWRPSDWPEIEQVLE